MKKYFKFMAVFFAFMVMLVVPSFAQEVAQESSKINLWDLLLNNIEIVSSGLFGLLTMIFGGKVLIVRNKFSQLVELLNEIQRALQDEKISKEEMEEIIKDAKALLGK